MRVELPTVRELRTSKNLGEIYRNREGKKAK